MSKHYIKDGYLHRDRLKGIKPVACPYSSSEEGDACGDWCALFQDAEKYATLHCAHLRITIEKFPKEVDKG